MPLTDIRIRNARPRKKPYKMYDASGLYLLVTPSGGKWWRFNYLLKGKQKTISLGVYPDVSLKEARNRRDRGKDLLAEGGDPSAMRKAQKTDGAMTYGELTMEWFENRKSTWVKRHAETVLQRINNYILPAFGDTPVTGITTPLLYKFLQGIEQSGKIETAHRVKQITSMIFRYGIVKGVAERDPASDLGRGMLTPSRPQHYATILEPAKIGALMRAIDGYEYVLVRCALKLLSLTFVRPGELRNARWEEFRLDERLWEIPAEKMKMKREHVVPLSKQAIALLKELRSFSSYLKSEYLFPSLRSRQRPISDVTMHAALRRMGYDTKKDITPHGFRAMARTILHERLKFPPEVIEHQLAHAVPDALGEAYNRTKFIDERKKMMQAWADYLDTVKTSFLIQSANGSLSVNEGIEQN